MQCHFRQKGPMSLDKVFDTLMPLSFCIIRVEGTSRQVNLSYFFSFVIYWGLSLKNSILIHFFKDKDLLPEKFSNLWGCQKIFFLFIFFKWKTTFFCLKKGNIELLCFTKFLQIEAQIGFYRLNHILIFYSAWQYWNIISYWLVSRGKIDK